MPKKMKRHNAPWTPAELLSMRRCAAKGDSSTDFADRTGRSVGAVKWKAMVNGVRFRSIAQPKGVQRKLAKLRQKYGMRATLESRAS